MDPHAARGLGYRHQVEGLDTSHPDYAVHRGWPRVRFNLVHFFTFWTVWPDVRGQGLSGLLGSDGNSASSNLLGHFGGSAALSIAGLCIAPSRTAVASCGTAVNVFHEFVAEGQYVDPSFIDLWLDQLGLFTALALSAGIGMWRRRAAVHRLTWQA